MSEFTRHTARLVSAVALSIASELREHPDHWMQGAGWHKKGSGRIVTEREADVMCLMGHIFKRTGDKHSAPVVAAFQNQLPDCQIPEWNDAPARRVGDVIALCEKVATLSDEERS